MGKADGDEDDVWTQTSYLITEWIILPKIKGMP